MDSKAGVLVFFMLFEFSLDGVAIADGTGDASTERDLWSEVDGCGFARVANVEGGSNRDGIGAEVTVFAGSRSWVQEVRSGSSYLSSSDLRLHFGLGEKTSVDKVEVRWPNGGKETFPAIQNVDRFVTLTESSGTAVSSSAVDFLKKH